MFLSESWPLAGRPATDPICVKGEVSMNETICLKCKSGNVLSGKLLNGE